MHSLFPTSAPTTHPNEGPVEKLGRKTDEALDDVKEAIEDVGERD